MDKNQPFFDPYNFNTMQPNTVGQSNIDATMEQMPNAMMYYEQQYKYYKYLT